MNRGLRLLVLLIMLVFISGASSCEKSSKVSPGAYIGGTDGLGISFVADEPPVKVLDNDQDSFFVTLALENKGEFNIPKGGVIGTISGLAKNDFSIASLSAQSANVIEGRHKLGGEIIEGVSDELNFAEARYKYDLSADLLQKMRVDVCYLYQTEGLAKLCLKKNPSERDISDICKVNNEAIDLETSSGPVKITNVKEQSAGGSEVIFMFDIENVGGGENYLPTTFSSKCVYDEGDKNKLKVSIESVSGDLKSKCSVMNDNSQGEVKLVSGKRKVTCRVSTSVLQEGAFESPFNIKLDYFYKVSLYKEITIENL